MRLEGLPDAPRGAVVLLGDGWGACAGSDLGVWYFMRLDDLFCVCGSWEYRRTCYHVDRVSEHVRLVQRLSVALETELKKQALPSETELRKLFG